jgi:hypothetical protein
MMTTMATKHSILRGLGILFVFMLVVFCGTFFYAYFSGGDSRVLSLFSGDGVGVLQIEGAIDDPPHHPRRAAAVPPDALDKSCGGARR